MAADRRATARVGVLLCAGVLAAFAYTVAHGVEHSWRAWATSAGPCWGASSVAHARTVEHGR